jgi:hypothetical protein
MGAWSIESFGNDSACDWAYSLEEETGLDLIRQTLENTFEDHYLDSSEGTEAIAAAEVIARLKGNFGATVDSYTETVDNWVKAHPQKTPQDLIALAVRALDRVLQPESELRDLWEESEQLEQWKASVLNLRQRVTG